MIKVFSCPGHILSVQGHEWLLWTADEEHFHRYTILLKELVLITAPFPRVISWALYQYEFPAYFSLFQIEFKLLRLALSSLSHLSPSPRQPLKIVFVSTSQGMKITGLYHLAHL